MGILYNVDKDVIVDLAFCVLGKTLIKYVLNHFFIALILITVEFLSNISSFAENNSQGNKA